jgi:hypothetical protein
VQKLLYYIIIPFGIPVLPDINIMYALIDISTLKTIKQEVESIILGSALSIIIAYKSNSRAR